MLLMSSIDLLTLKDLIDTIKNNALTWDSLFTQEKEAQGKLFRHVQLPSI